MRPTVIAGLVVTLFAVGIAVLGGEYTTFDWLRLKRTYEQEQADTARLHAEIDSLLRELDLIVNDSATQERVAREEFGMIRDGELLYRLVPSR